MQYFSSIIFLDEIEESSLWYFGQLGGIWLYYIENKALSRFPDRDAALLKLHHDERMAIL